MKTHLHLKSLGALLFILVACNPQKSNTDNRTIDIASVVGKGEIMDLSKIAKDITYVPLETTDSSLVGSIYSVFYENGHIYIRDNTKSIKVFDSKGKYIKKINRYGRGPEEYTDIFDFSVIPKSGNITILSMSGTLNEYDMFGNFVSSTKRPDLKDYNILECIKIDENTYVASVFKPGEVGEYSTIVYDSLSNIKMRIPNPDPDYGKTIANASGWGIVKAPSLSQFGNNIRILHRDIEMDTIFSIDAGMKLDRPFVFNYGGYKKTSDNSTDISESSKIISHMGMLVESEDYLFLKFNFRGLAQEPMANGTKHVAALFYKNNGELTLLNQPIKGTMGFRNDIENGPVFWPITATSNNQLLCTYTAAGFIDFVKNNNCSDKIRKVAEKLNENDNPVIAIVRLK